MGHRVIPIGPVLDAYRGLPDFVESPYTLGNLMARTRMAILYYYANRDNLLVCGTSNRTEHMLGYFTKFGDGAGDIEPIIHLLKREVYELARALEIPEKIIVKPPSAGLWKDQRDEDEIGLDYNAIDQALIRLEQHGWKSGSPTEEKVLALIRKSEHKRLAPPSLSRSSETPC
jgi:NAD+ synthase